jgi:small subunit ribosomal protein S20
MPHHNQFKKSIRKSEKSTLRNRAAKSKLNTFTTKVRTAKSKEDAVIALTNAVSVIDSTISKGIIKKETGARKKSRLYKFVAKMS